MTQTSSDQSGSDQDIPSAFEIQIAKFLGLGLHTFYPTWKTIDVGARVSQEDVAYEQIRLAVSSFMTDYMLAVDPFNPQQGVKTTRSLFLLTDHYGSSERSTKDTLSQLVERALEDFPSEMIDWIDIHLVTLLSDFTTEKSINYSPLISKGKSLSCAYRIVSKKDQGESSARFFLGYEDIRSFANVPLLAGSFKSDPKTIPLHEFVDAVFRKLARYHGEDEAYRLLPSRVVFLPMNTSEADELMIHFRMLQNILASQRYNALPAEGGQ